MGIKVLSSKSYFRSRAFSLHNFLLFFHDQLSQEKFLSYGRILTLHYYFLLMCILFSLLCLNFLKEKGILVPIFLFLVFSGIRELSFGILFIWKLHQIHFVFLLILLGY